MCMSGIVRQVDSKDYNFAFINKELMRNMQQINFQVDVVVGWLYLDVTYIIIAMSSSATQCSINKKEQ